MKKAALLLCGIACLVLIAATAHAKPPARKGGRGLEQVSRPAPHFMMKRAMLHQHRARSSMMRQSQRRAPTQFHRPRIKGDLFGENHIRRATASRYANGRTSRAADRVKNIAEGRIQARVSCVDGTNCGKMRSNGANQARSSVKHKVTSTLASAEERQRSYRKQVWQIRIDKRAKPQKLKELESGCNDFAACL